MTITRTEGVLCVAALMMSTGLLLAHHGDSGRYEDKLTTVKGNVAEIILVNPHSTLVLDVKDESGKTVKWRGELFLEDGLHRAVRAALQQRTVLHARVLDLD